MIDTDPTSQDFQRFLDVLLRRCPEVIECCSQEQDPDARLWSVLTDLIIAAIELECADEAVNNNGEQSLDRLDKATSAFKRAVRIVRDVRALSVSPSLSAG